MENKQSLTNNKLISIKEEKLFRQVDYDTIAGVPSRLPKKELVLEIFRKGLSGSSSPSQRVLVSIKPRAPAIKTIYIAEKNRFNSRRNSDKSGSRSRLGIGDHSSLNSSYISNITGETSEKNTTHIDQKTTESEVETGQVSSSTEVTVSKCSDERELPLGVHEVNAFKDKQRPAEKCYICTQPLFYLNPPKKEAQRKENFVNTPNKADIGTITSIKSTSEESIHLNYRELKRIHHRIDRLERRLLRQEMVFQSLDPNLQLSSSDEECKDMRAAMGSGRACCSYIQQYSHVPETSAFQRYVQGPLMHNHSTLEKEHNSEQYGRDFTTYDGIMARGRRQSASVPSKRDDFPKVVAERVHKIRHKLNPVRDYRLMDTVHYLAQGEFAPRDDGIKLTPSREAVLSDIIWEDVCRTHWPNARLGRRGAPSDRYGTRYELQRLIDSLLRERVAHVERRRRRHYRIVKLNHRHESCRPVGKTGDIIVASHKKKDSNEEQELPISDHSAASAMMADRKWEPRSSKKGPRSHDRLMYPDSKHRRRFREEECMPGPSSAGASGGAGAGAVSRGPGGSREPTYCYHSSSPQRLAPASATPTTAPPNPIATSGTGSGSHGAHTPRLIVKKETSRSHRYKEEPNLEQYILLPTLVIRTPSNMKRQKKFNELYHRILKMQTNNKECAVGAESAPPSKPSVPAASANKKDIGLNINITSDENPAMESVKKWLSDRTAKRNGLYVHYSPPKMVDVASSAQFRMWARGKAAGKLERAVLAGQGRRLLAELPTAGHLAPLVLRCEALHAALERGSLLDLQELLESDYNRKKHVMCCDEAGVGLLHKAVYYGYMDIASYLVENYPLLVHQRDSEGRTPLHYAAACREPAAAAGLLERAGAARGARDAAGRRPAAYRGAGRTLLALPTAADMPPDQPRNPPGLVIKRHNIRIWCHDCDMAKLQRVVWEGHGTRLLSEVSNQPVVKKFLEAVPYIMNTIKDIHSAVIQNDLEGLMKLSGDPVPPLILSSRDPHNLTVMHKAAGLGHGGILSYIAERYSQGINDVDNDGRTPLHYAAAVRDDQHTYNTLVSLGADESAVDNKNRTPAYYINRPQEIDKNIFQTLPDAPRTPSSAYPPSWDWKILNTDAIVELHKKSRRKNHRTSNENISSKNNSNSISENTNTSTRRGMKNSSTQELIHNLPELDDKRHNDNNEKDTKEIEEEEVDIEKETEHKEQDAELAADENEPNEPENEKDTKDDDEATVENPKGIQDEEETKQDDEESQMEDHDDAAHHEEKDSQSEQEHEDIENNENNSNDGEKNNIAEDNLQNTNSNEETTDEQDTNKQDKEDDKSEDEEDPATKEGNNKHQHNEDDEDVHVQGDSQSEYSDIHQRSTAEATDTAIAKRGNESDGRNTQESLIEGIISGDAERDSQDASIQKDETVQGEILVVDSEIDPEVTELINTANMEMLAQLVLNGEGSRLVGRRSGNLELQSFLDNVPTYMQKINRVHIAAREGNIRDLQAALDRRKFAIARDPISPNGVTPLHVATICGKTNIIKYLGGRFPETLSAVDFEGRTALHYAAVLPDNGHYYNVLQQLGANAKDLDDNGRSAEDYFKDPESLSYNQLLADFGIDEDMAQGMLADKVPEDRVSSRRALDASEALDTLDRCYRLLSSARPARTPLSASSNRSTPPLVLGRFLKKSVFDIIKYRVTKLDHDLFDVIWPAVKKLPENRNIIQTVEEDFPGGITAPDHYVYEVFHEFMIPLIKDLHNINIHSDFPLHPPTDFDKNKPVTTSTTTTEPIVELNIDPNDDFVLSGTIECSRNLDGFELPLNLKTGQLETIERIVTTLLTQEDFSKYSEQNNPESDQKGGNYYTLNEVLEKPSEICAALASAGLLIALCDREEIDDCTRLHGRHWPYGRGVYVNDDKTIAIWINVHDHIRVMICTPTDAPGEIGIPFSKMTHIMTYLHERLDFVWDYKLGHLSSRPTFLGSGIRFSLIVNFPGLSKDIENMKHLCAVRGLQYRETMNVDIARISNYQCLGITEMNCFKDFITATSNLLHLERDLSMQSSAHIATMLTNIFKRKRSSLADIDHPDEH